MLFLLYFSGWMRAIVFVKMYGFKDNSQPDNFHPDNPNPENFCTDNYLAGNCPVSRCTNYYYIFLKYFILHWYMAFNSAMSIGDIPFLCPILSPFFVSMVINPLDIEKAVLP